jgi:hypothetical protein
MAGMILFFKRLVMILLLYLLTTLGTSIWPTLELFIPIGSKKANHPRYHEYETVFLRSFLLFWPLKVSNVSVRVALDGEDENSEHYNRVKSVFEGVKGRIPGGISIQPITETGFYRNGKDRQQLMMFWADNFTSAEYVGFCDTDTLFLTYIDKFDLFEDGKPVINGRSGPSDNEFWKKSPLYVNYTLGVLEPMRCMSYFPVIIKSSHLKDMREYIVRYHGGNRSFNNLFYDISGIFPVFQFDLMCAYLYNFKRDEYKWYEYKWYAHRTVPPSWDGTNPKMFPGQIKDFSNFSHEMFTPKPRIASHAGYRSWPAKNMG